MFYLYHNFLFKQFCLLWRICFVQPITTKSKTKMCIIMFCCAACCLNRSSLWNKFCEQKLKCLHIPWLHTLNPNLGKIKPYNQNRMQSETVHTFWKYKNFNQKSIATVLKSMRTNKKIVTTWVFSIYAILVLILMMSQILL